MWKSALIAIALLTLSAPAAVRAAGAEGGSAQVAAQPGCMNEWLFNGVWRVRVTNVAFHPATDGANGWDVTMQWANGTNYSGISPGDTLKQTLVLALANGDTLSADDSTRGNMNQQQLDFHTFPASGQFTYTQMFLSGPPLDQNNKPAKLLVTFDVAKYKKNTAGGTAKFWTQKTPAYNYRIDLTCSK
jgi:hypothetical protein